MHTTFIVKEPWSSGHQDGLQLCLSSCSSFPPPIMVVEMGADCWAVVWASCSSEAPSIVLPFPSLWIVLHILACTPYFSCLIFPSHLFFSGTTGEPKGVLLSHRAVVSDIASKYRYLIDSGYNVRLTITCVW